MAQKETDQVEAPEAFANVWPALGEEDDSVDLVEVFRKLRREAKLILSVTLAVGALVTGIAFLLPLRYTSTTSFIPPSMSSGSSMASMVSGQLSALGAGDLLGAVKNPADLYAGILKSHSIADELIDQYHLKDVYRVKKVSQAEKMLISNTDVSVDTKSSIVTVAVTARSPQLAHDLTKAYMDALRETNGRLALGQSSQRRLFFGQQLEKEKDDLGDAEVELKKTEEQSGLIAPNGQTEAQIRTLAQTQAEIAVREVQLAALRDSATEQNPEVIRLRSEVGNLQGQLSRLQRGGGGEANIPTSKVPELQLEYVRKEREVKYHEALFEMLSRQYEAARLDEARDAPVLQVLDAASYPDTKSAPKRSYYMAGGLVFGFIAGSIWVLARERVQVVHAAIAANETSAH